MKNYKGTDSKMCCQGFQFELGKRYSIPEDQAIEICETGFHSCDKLWDVPFYYPVENSRYFEVDVEDTITALNKNCSRHITFVRELTFYEVMRMLNRPTKDREFSREEENTNKGFMNCGNYNTGNNNNGNYNIGNDNNGNSNTGNNNNGDYNTGNDNNGVYNVGSNKTKTTK